MYINKSGKCLIIGRFRIGVDEPVPGVPLTEAEKNSIAKFTEAGLLTEYVPAKKAKAASTDTAADETETAAAETKTETASTDTKSTKKTAAAASTATAKKTETAEKAETTDTAAKS